MIPGGGRRRFRAVGSYVALNDTMPKTVAFILGRRSKHGLSQPTPIGTGFFLGVRTPEEPPSTRAFTLYLITAAHVVGDEPETWLRVRRLDGTLVDIPVPEWKLHDRADVALTVLDLDESEQPFDIAVMPIPDFFDLEYVPMLGDRVYFIGLFSPIPAMGEQNVPLVRSGTLAAWAQERVPLRMPDNTVVEYTAHLIDCRSYSGFSGSPCVVQFPREPGIGGVGRPNEATELIGLVSSHFDFKENASLTGEIAELGKVDVPVHLGVGVVMPAERIQELLDREDVVADRKKRERGFERRTEEEQPASTPDVVSVQDESEFDRFEDLARKLVNTPKSDIDEKRKNDS
jgi:hypothetical protein